MSNNPWFRFYNDFIYDEKIEFVSFEDQRHFVFILCMKNLGLLDKEYPQPEMRERAISKRLGLHGEAFENAKTRLMNAGLIDDAWNPTGWDKRQFVSDNADRNAKRNAERQKRYRERKKEEEKQQDTESNVTNNVTITPLDTDTDTDTDTEKKNKEKKPRFKKPSLADIQAYISEKNFTFSAEEFFDANETKGWVVGKNNTPMQDWKSAMRTWQRNREAWEGEKTKQQVASDGWGGQRI